MKSVLILEDDIEMLKLIEKIMNELDDTIYVYKISTLPEAYQIAIEKNINLFVIDIMLDQSIRDDVSGLKFVEKLRRLDKYNFIPVVFITALADPELHAYRNLHCYGYLEKPLVIEDAKKLFAEALKFKQPEEGETETLYLRRDGVIYAAKKKEIVYISSHAGKVTIKTIDDELTFYYRNCKEMLEKLDSEKFIQCNRATIVNRDYIKSIDPTNRMIQLKGFGNIEIGITMKKKIMEWLNDV